MRYLLALLISLLPLTASAAPRVVADIAPVHSIAAAIMQGASTPELLVPATADVHGIALRPSDARRLSEADIVFWIGPALSPWLSDPLDSLAPQAQRIALTELDLPTLLPTRENAAFEAHDHDHDHDEHATDAPIDPHIWLAPENAIRIAAHMAQVLGEADPVNAALYQANATQLAARIEAASAVVETTLAPHANGAFIVLHDAYHYFEDRFGIAATAAISASDAAAPGAARLQAVRALIAETPNLRCLFAEPQQADAQARQIAQDTGLYLATLDPMGVDLPPGPALFPELIENLAASLAECLAKD